MKVNFGAVIYIFIYWQVNICCLCLRNPLGGTVVYQIADNCDIAIHFSSLLLNQHLHDSCEDIWVTLLRPPWQADGQLHVNDTSYEVTSNCGAGQATGKVSRCPEKLGQCKGDDPFRLAYFNSPSPKCWPGGGLHHSLSSTWSKHPTQDT